MKLSPSLGEAAIRMLIIRQSVRLASSSLNVEADKGIYSTVAAAEDAWKAVQALYRSLPELNNNIRSKTFNLATQSYGLYSQLARQIRPLAGCQLYWVWSLPQLGL